MEVAGGASGVVDGSGDMETIDAIDACSSGNGGVDPLCFDAEDRGGTANGVIVGLGEDEVGELFVFQEEEEVFAGGEGGEVWFALEESFDSVAVDMKEAARSFMEVTGFDPALTDPEGWEAFGDVESDGEIFGGDPETSWDGGAGEFEDAALDGAEGAVGVAG